MKPFPRKKKLINLALQLRMIGVFTALSCFAALAQVALLGHSMVSVSQDLGPDGAEFASRLPGLMREDFAWTFGFLLPFMLLVGLHITHKVAGPIHRIDLYLKQVTAKGSADQPCRIRAGDELQPLVDSLNRAFARLTADRDQDSDASETPETLERLREAA